MQALIPAGGQDRFPVAGTGEGQFHVALPAGQPYLPEIDAGEGLGIPFAAQHQREGPARGLGRQGQLPAAGGIGGALGGNARRVQSGGNDRAGGSGPPKGNIGFPLQHHIAAEHGGRVQFHFTFLLSGKQDFCR